MTTVTTMLCPVSYAELRVSEFEALVWCPRCQTNHSREFLRDRDETPCSTCGHRRSGHGRHRDRSYACQLSTCICSTKETSMTCLIRSSVEPDRGETSIEYHQLPDNWNDMSEAEQESLLVDIAVTHQTNVAPCGAGVVDVDDAELARIRRDGLIVE